MTVMNKDILQTRAVCCGFEKTHGELKVLDDVNLDLKEGEIVGLLGRSGSGKSTLLRILAGLIPASAGAVNYLGKPVLGPVKGVAMVFQTFALFPWLTVLENVEAGLEAQGIEPAERRQRALKAIDLIGLDGFESAYPRELSGGMRQRVGFARALVVHPTVMLMDEPFSALDVLTAETLRTDLLDLWHEGSLPIKSMLMVTHNIEEAAFMCDRIVIMSSNPGRMVANVAVPFAHPRNRLDPAFRQFVDDIYRRMTQPGLQEEASPAVSAWARRLPEVSTNLLAGLMETLVAAPYAGRADMPEIAQQLHLEIDDLFPVAELLQYLGFASMFEGDITLTAIGTRYALGGIQERKALFAAALLRGVPLAAHIQQVLQDRPKQRAPRSRFLQELEDGMTTQAAEATLNAVINLGRYAEIFSYDDQSELFSLEDVA